MDFRDMRSQLAAKMTLAQIVKTQRMAREGVPKWRLRLSP